jgi:hypothetical protein
MMKTERGNCRFVVSSTQNQPSLHLEIFHDSIKPLSKAKLSFELLPGTTLNDAKRLAESMNEWIRAVALTQED